ncbi:MAG: DUF3256 family protein [Muribaculaceae bacterium]|nr:DUF3256 family protein [Muribaculaceae bacterium]
MLNKDISNKKEDFTDSKRPDMLRALGVWMALAFITGFCNIAMSINPPLLNPGVIAASGETDAAPDSTSLVAQAFALIPDADLDILTKEMRKEMTIYMENDSVYRIRNIYSGQSWIDEMNQDYIRIHLTNVSNLQIKSLPYDKKGINLIMTIYTISGDPETADSTIKFYNLVNPESPDASLTELPIKNFFKLPNPKDFYDLKAGDLKSAGRKMSMDDIMEEMPFHTIEYSISPKGSDLTGRLTISNYLTMEARKRLEPYMRPELHWAWDGKHFSPTRCR